MTREEYSRLAITASAWQDATTTPATTTTTTTTATTTTNTATTTTTTTTYYYHDYLIFRFRIFDNACYVSEN